jgi:hypothetical protein
VKRDWEFRVSKYFKKIQSTELEIVCRHRQQSAKKRSLKSIKFCILEKTYIENPKSQLSKHFLVQNFKIFHLKKISSLAHWEVPQIRDESAASNTYAARKTLAAHCIHIYGHNSTVLSKLIFKPYNTQLGERF